MLAAPPLARAGPALTANRLGLDSAADLNLHGRTLEEWRAWTRREASVLAADYLHQLLGDTDSTPPTAGPWIVTGHQPAMFHPGVWAKNFAAHALARRFGGVALNLIVDNDLLTGATLAVPRGPRIEPTLQIIPLVDSPLPRPWEEVRIESRATFAAVGAAVAAVVQSEWGYRPLIADAWPDAVAACERTPLLADWLTAMRARQERRWGLGTLEVPLSRLEESDPFRWFAADVIARAGSVPRRPQRRAR